MITNQLSKHFHTTEFACPCCGKSGISRILVVDILEPIREYFSRPVIINPGGGVRCEAYNRRIRYCDTCEINYHGWTCEGCGGPGRQRSAKNSWHLKGTQADICVAGIAPKEIQEFARSLPAVTRLGCYRTFTHVGLGGSSYKEWEG